MADLPENVKVVTPDDVVEWLLVAGVNLTAAEKEIVRKAIAARDEVWQAIVEAMRT